MHPRELKLEQLDVIFAQLPKGAARSVIGLIRRYSYTISVNQRIVGFYDDGELIGAVMYGFVAKKGYVNLIGMAIPDHLQKRGIGVRVLREVAARAKAAGLKDMKTQAYNKKSQAWYERFGFAFDEKRYTLLNLDTLLERVSA